MVPPIQYHEGMVRGVKQRSQSCQILWQGHGRRIRKNSDWRPVCFEFLRTQLRFYTLLQPGRVDIPVRAAGHQRRTRMSVLQKSYLWAKAREVAGVSQESGNRTTFPAKPSALPGLRIGLVDGVTGASSRSYCGWKPQPRPRPSTSSTDCTVR